MMAVQQQWPIVSNWTWCIAIAAAAVAAAISESAAEPQGNVRVQIVEAGSKRPLPARVYVRGDDGAWFFARSAVPDGSAVEYRKQRSPNCSEMHTTVSAHPFVFDLPPGRYALAVERGKEYLPVERTIEVGQEPVDVTIELVRWIDMAARGWYSGDTHVHRTLAELPNVVAAEDLNVALPLSYWVTASHTPPAAADKSTAQELRPEPIWVDPAHVIYPVNTEYEIFSVRGRQHTLGAVFVLGHRAPLAAGAPPVRPIAEQARREGALLDLDKHSWPWSLMIVPVMQVDLFELANNHVWRTEFGFPGWTRETEARYMRLETDAAGFTEWGWIDFGLQTYYGLLNCGFRPRPTAGTASGVHPVPLGFGRVYVQLGAGQPLDYQQWMAGLGAGGSFVTTGPMLLVEVDGQPPGSVLQRPAGERTEHRVTGAAESAVPLDRIEIVANGRVVQTLTPANERTGRGGFVSPFDVAVPLDGSGWIAVRAFEARADRRVRFAHSSPVHVEVPGKPLVPRRSEVEYFAQRMDEEIARNLDVLSAAELDEYRQALAIYRRIAATARPD